MELLHHIALVTDSDAQAIVLQQLLRTHATFRHARSELELHFFLATDQFDVVFCDTSIKNGTWKDALDNVRLHTPDLPVIVLSKTGDEHEWVEVLQAGAFDLLVPPYAERDVLCALEYAAASRRARAWQAPEPNHNVLKAVQGAGA